MKKIYFIFTFIFAFIFNAFSNNLDSLQVVNIEDVSIVSFYRQNSNNVISKDYISNSNNGQEPSFIFNGLPSIYAYSDTGNEYGYSYFRMRGMDQTRINMTLDGMPLAEGEDMGVYFSNYPDILSSMQSIKIDNGANVSNNGTAGYAGSINFESIDLTADNPSYAYFGFGSFNTYKTNIQYNSGKIGKFAFHANVTNQQSDGFRDYAYNNSQSAFIKAGYFINDNHSLDILSFIGHSRNGQAWIGSTLDELNINFSNNGCTSEETDRFIQNITKLQYKGIFNKTILTASVYYNFLDGYYFFDVDNYCNKIYNYPHKAGEIDKYDLQHHMIGGNIATKTYIGNSFILTSGINYSNFNRRHIGYWNIDDSQLWNNKGYKNDLNVFVNGNYTYKNFTLNGNIQYRHADFDYSGNVNFDKINWDFLNWSVNLKYQIKNKHYFYASITQTHREPTRSDMFGGNENFSELVTKQAESVIDYEIGYNLNIDRFNFNINGYYMDFDNELILNGEYGTNGLPIRNNEANSYRYGIEMNMNYNPMYWLNFNTNVSYSKNKIETNNDKFTHVMSPNWTISQDVEFTINNFNIGVNYKFRSSMFIDLPNNHKLNNSSRFNIFADYNIKDKIIISANVNNVFNVKTYSNGMLGVNEMLYFVDAPRNFFVSVKFKF